MRLGVRHWVAFQDEMGSYWEGGRSRLASWHHAASVAPKEVKWGVLLNMRSLFSGND